MTNRRKIWILIILTVVGLLTHYQSFNLSLYGDDWIDVLHFHLHDITYAQVSNLPGLLAFVTPYGFAILLVGGLFQVFGTNYIWYFILSFIFKMLAVFSLLLVTWEIGALVDKKINSSWFFILTGVLLVVSYTGIQTTDWIHYTNIYLATALYLSGLWLQIKFYRHPKRKYMLLSVFFILVSLITGALRLYPITVLTPLIDLVLYSNFKSSNVFKLLMEKYVVFGLAVTILLAIGLFGSPFSFYSYGDWSFHKFVDLVSTHPLLTLRSFLYSVGSLLLPDRLVANKQLIISVGMMLVTISGLTIIEWFKSKRTSKAILILGVGFWSFYLMIWYFGPNSFFSSEHRYLYVPFVWLILWLNSLYTYFHEELKSVQKLFLLVILILICLQLFSTWSFYNLNLKTGRGAAFTKEVEEKIIADLPKPTNTQQLVYFEVDDGSTKQSLLFGLAVKTLVLQQTWDTKLMFQQFDDYKEFQKAVDKKSGQLGGLDKTLELVYGYRVKNLQITSITTELRQQLSLGLRPLPDQDE